MERYDDELRALEADGPPPLPAATVASFVERDGAKIWYAAYGSGAPVLLLHGGLGSAGDYGHQVPALVRAGYRVVLVDSRGHGRSTRDARPFTYELMAADARAVLDALRLERAALVGWSDGAVIALLLAMQEPARVSGVFFFGCNMDPSGTKQPFEQSPVVDRMFARHARNYALLSATPGDFQTFVAAIGRMMNTQPNYSAAQLATVRVPVTIVQSERDEFISREHAEYLARSIPGARLVILPDVSHFAPLQRPQQFNSAVFSFLGGLSF